MRTIAIRRQSFKYLICEDFHADSNLQRDAMENNEGLFSFQENIYTFLHQLQKKIIWASCNKNLCIPDLRR